MIQGSGVRSNTAVSRGQAMIKRSFPREGREHVALGSQLRHVPCVVTIGVRPNLEDYRPWEMDLIERAQKIYFPTLLYADTLSAMGKTTFPSVHSYRHLGDKIKQTHLFQILGLPMPYTRLYYGQNKEEKILNEFAFPFIGKVPRGSSRGDGIYLIRDSKDLHSYLNQTPVGYIQQYVPLGRDIRVVILGKRIVHAYWRKAGPGEFRTNVAKGGRPCAEPVPGDALELALQTALCCGFDHVGLDLCEDQGRFLVFEANMVFGEEGFKAAGLDYKEILKELVETGEV